MKKIIILFFTALIVLTFLSACQRSVIDNGDANINTSNNPSYIFLDLVGLPTIKNTSSGAVQVALYVNISGVSIMIDSTNLNSGFIVNLKETAVCIDAINKKLIYYGRSSSNINLQKAITHL